MDRIEPATLVILVVTALSSWKGFQDRGFVEKLIFRPERILAGKEYYRVLTSGFIHADWQHLFMNMITLYIFGNRIEFMIGIPHYLLIYFGSILGGSILSLWLHRNHDYSALGASAGVCGLIFASIFLFPGGSMMIFPFPFWIPSWLFAILFLLGEFYGIGNRYDNIGHDAHLGGAILGLLITAGLFPHIVQYSPKLFFSVLALSGTLLAYLIMNPILLPPWTIWSAYLESRRNRVPGKSRSAAPTMTKGQESERMDALLEKISEQGFQSLSEEEKTFLRRMSQKRR